MVTKKCVVCSGEFNAVGNAKTCSILCSKEYKRGDMKRRSKSYAEKNIDKTKAYKRKWYLENKDRLNTPEEKDRQKELRNKPENKARKKEYSKEYLDRPEVKTRQIEYAKNYRENNKDKSKEYYQENKDKVKAYNQKPEVLEKRREWYKTTEYKERKKLYRERPKVKERRHASYQKDKKIIRKKHKKYYNKNKKKLKILNEAYRKKNEEKIKKYRNSKKYKNGRNKNRRHRYKVDSNYKIENKLRNRLRIALRDYTKNGKIKSADEYGINYKRIIEYLKPFPQHQRFYHIDHIKPICSFNFTNKDGSQNLDEIRKAFAPENHQWLLAKENMSKGGKIIVQSKL